MWCVDYYRQKTSSYRLQSKKEPTYPSWTSSKAKSIQRRCTSPSRESERESSPISSLGDLQVFRLPCPSVVHTLRRLTRCQEWCLRIIQVSAACSSNSWISISSFPREALSWSSSKRLKYFRTILKSSPMPRRWSAASSKSTPHPKSQIILSGARKLTAQMAMTEWHKSDTKNIHLIWLLMFKQ